MYMYLKIKLGVGIGAQEQAVNTGHAFTIQNYLSDEQLSRM